MPPGTPLHDAHAHLTHPRLRDDVDAVLDRARDAGVTRVIANGLNYSDNLAVQALSRRRPDIVRPAYGLYPVDAVLEEMTAAGVDYPRDPGEIRAEETIAWVREHAGEAIAIGEVGLDGKWVPSEFWPLQEQRFCAMVELALAADRPLIIHSRKRELRCFELCRELGAERVLFHAYSSKLKLAQRIAEAGYYLSVPSNARRADQYGALVRKIPRERLLLETDAPYLSPDRERWPRNEPATVAETVAFAAEVWSEPAPSAAQVFADNYERLFREPAS